MSDKKQFLGWGLVGTPNGRQYTSDGIDKQLNLAKAFELEQSVGKCLPNPQLKDVTPLYVLRQRNVGSNHMLGFGEYYSINERGQNRAGTYFGSFIETLNSTFNENSLKDIFHTLFLLSEYQTKHFIDTNAKEYHASINGATFEAPHHLLSKIAEDLQPLERNYLTQSPQEKDLFIHCEKNTALAIAKVLLASGWFNQYQNIFFTENEYISQQIQGSKIGQLSSAQLLNSEMFTLPWKKEVGYLHSIIVQEQNARQHLFNENQQLKAEQHNLVTKEVERQAGQYIAELEQTKKRLQDSESLAQLGQQVFDTVVNNAEQLGNSQLAQYSSAANNEVLSRLTGLDNRIASLSLKMNEQQPTTSQMDIENGKNPLAIVFGILSLVFFIFAVTGWGFYLVNSTGSSIEENVKSMTDNVNTHITNELGTLKNSLEKVTNGENKNTEIQSNEPNNNVESFKNGKNSSGKKN